MLLHILPAPAAMTGGYTSAGPDTVASYQEGPSPAAATIHQVDVSERQLLVSTTEPRVYLFNLDDEGQLLPVGGAKAGNGGSTSTTTSGSAENGQKRATKKRGGGGARKEVATTTTVGHCSGVTALATYRLLELNRFNFDDDDEEEDEDSNSSNDFESNHLLNSYTTSGEAAFGGPGGHRFPRRPHSRTPASLLGALPVKAYRLVTTECTFFATRPKCRLWVVDDQGAVQFTQQYAELVKREISAREEGGGTPLEGVTKEVLKEGGDQLAGESTTHLNLIENGLAKEESAQKALKKKKIRKKKASREETVLRTGTSASSSGGSMLQHSSVSYLNFGKLYSLYWRNTGREDEGEPVDLADSLTVFSYIVTYSSTSLGGNSSANSSANSSGVDLNPRPHPPQQVSRPRLFVIDPNSQVILATSPPIEGQIEEVKCIGNDVFVGYRTEPTASLQLAVLTLRLHTPPKCKCKSPFGWTNLGLNLINFVVTFFFLIAVGDDNLKENNINCDTGIIIKARPDFESTEVATEKDPILSLSPPSPPSPPPETPALNLLEEKEEEDTNQETSPLAASPTYLDLTTTTSPTSPTSTNFHLTLHYYLLLLQLRIMEQSTNKLGEQTLCRLRQRLAEQALRSPKRSNLKVESSTLVSPTHPHHPHRPHMSLPSSQPSESLPLNGLAKSKFKFKPNKPKPPKGQSSSTTYSGLSGRVMDLRKTRCALCRQFILSEGASGGAKVKLYRSCEHVFHATCSRLTGSSGRCTLCC